MIRGTLRDRLRAAARESGISTRVRRVFGRLGFDLIGRDYYSPIPNTAKLRDNLFTARSELQGLTVDLPAALEFLEQDLAPYASEYKPPEMPTDNPRDFYLDNGFYGQIDAELLYAMVRRLNPSQLIELGSGMSTLVIADARAKNADISQTRHAVYDPYPRADLVGTLGRIAELHTISANDVPLSEFERLRSGDILFIDTTHTVKTGGEVNRIILDVLPVLAPGTFVHFHDIFLPWEYPYEFLADRNFFWSEQYLLQAFLAFNREFEVVLPVHALNREFPAQIEQLIPSARPGLRAAAFWLRRVERPGWDEDS